MAKDDYHVIVYQILSYLYQCLKKGQKVEETSIKYNCKYFQINEEYWVYILYHMQECRLIEGIVFADIDGMELNDPPKMVHRSTQADNFIFDISKCPLAEDNLIEQTKRLFTSRHIKFVNNVVLMKDDKIMIVLQRE